VDGKTVYFSEIIECTSEAVTVRQLYVYMLHLASQADPMPANQHPVTPEEDKMVHSNGSIGSFVPGPVLARRIALSLSGQLPLKRPSEGPGDETGGSSSSCNQQCTLSTLAANGLTNGQYVDSRYLLHFFHPQVHSP